jgi:hypothetical protein
VGSFNFLIFTPRNQILHNLAHPPTVISTWHAQLSHVWKSPRYANLAGLDSPKQKDCMLCRESRSLHGHYLHTCLLACLSALLTPWTKWNETNEQASKQAKCSVRASLPFPSGVCYSFVLFLILVTPCKWVWQGLNEWNSRVNFLKEEWVRTRFVLTNCNWIFGSVKGVCQI